MMSDVLYLLLLHIFISCLFTVYYNVLTKLLHFENLKVCDIFTIWVSEPN